VRSGGGIDPDIVTDAPQLNPFQQSLLAHIIFYPTNDGVGKFTRHYLAARPAVSSPFVPSNEVIAEFKRYLESQKFAFTQADFAANRSWIAWSIKREVSTAMLGESAGKRILLEQDSQLDKAMDSMPQASALYANARKYLAQRQQGQRGAGGI
jgi:hypothetical protein